MGITDVGLVRFQVSQELSCRIKVAKIPAEDCVDESRLSAEAISLRQLNGFVDCGVVRDAIQPENLVKPHSQQILQERLWRRIPGLSGNQPIEGRLPPDDAVDQFLA